MFLLTSVTPASAVEDLTRGLRFDPPILCLAEAPSDPNVAYVGTARGFVYVTRDGGQSWDELRLLTPRGQFFGSIRGGGSEGFTYQGVSGLVQLESSAYFDFSGLDFQDEFEGLLVGSQLPPLPTADSGIAARGVSGRLFDDFSDGLAGRGPLGSAGGAGADSSLGVGLSANAPRLAGAVRRKRGWGVGINLKQTLSLKSGAATAVRFLDVHPRDANDVVAATADGLYRTRDGGLAWALMLTGATPAERGINHLRRSAVDPNLLYVGTGRGVHVSRDGGDTFDKFENPLVTSSDVQWIELHPTDPNTLFVGVSWALLKSTDGGREFSITHRSPWPALGFVRRILVDARSPNTVFIGTADGLLRSTDGGETFERSGGPVFIGTSVVDLAAGDHAGHFFMADKRDLWETDDGGKTWRTRLFGAAQWDVRAIVRSHTPGALWVITSAEILRISPPGRRAPVPGWLVDRYRQIVDREPSLQSTVAAALSRAGVDLNETRAALTSSRWAAFLPRVEAAWYANRTDVSAQRLLVALGEPTLFTRGPFNTDYFAVLAQWDLLGIIHQNDESPARRLPRVVRSAEWAIRATTTSLFQERRRLQLDALTADADPRARLFRNLRFEELTAHLNALTGDLFAPYSAL